MMLKDIPSQGMSLLTTLISKIDELYSLYDTPWTFLARGFPFYQPSFMDELYSMKVQLCD
jgi:hypothetical protein